VRVFLAGSAGQLGSALARRLGDRVVWAGGRDALDVRDPAAVLRCVSDARPDVIINATAYNKVDAAETETLEALAVNAAGPAHLARAAREVGALVVHVSTDYVFDGTKTTPYEETDTPHPLSAYGVSKLAGDLLVRASGVPFLLVRTSAVFGAGGSRGKGGSFVERILARARAGQPLRVVDDQVLSPTYAPDLAAAIVALIEAGVRGLFHVTGAGSTSWHGFAAAAVRQAGLDAPVQAVKARDYAAPATRPAYSVLSNGRYLSLGLPPLRGWEAALAELLAKQGAEV
jgi:dTDP-4-dehydrorhamnose reductase